MGDERRYHVYRLPSTIYGVPSAVYPGSSPQMFRPRRGGEDISNTRDPAYVLRLNATLKLTRAFAGRKGRMMI
jgi:hypothetical protein